MDHLIMGTVEGKLEWQLNMHCAGEDDEAQEYEKYS
jgi:hypothetical protein